MTRTVLNALMAGLVTATLGSTALVAPAHAGGGQNGFTVKMTSEEMRLFAAGLANRNGTIAPSSGNNAIYQSGNNNAAGLAQNGRKNTGVIYQEGSGHTGTVQQNGNRNAGALFQFGKNTSGNVVQNGNGEKGATFQFGW